jgi:hypothetical protein
LTPEPIICIESAAKMKLPNADKAVVEREKITDYLLNPAHPDNGGKARFFGGLGFRRSEWKTLASAFLALAHKADVAQSMESPHGRKYVRMLLLVVLNLNRRKESRLPRKQSGLWTKVRMWPDWSRRIRTKNEKCYDQRA